MIVAAFSDYLPLDDLVRILAVCLFVAVVAPAAVSVSIVGFDRRAQAKMGSSRTAGLALIVLGAATLAALVALGLYALING